MDDQSTMLRMLKVMWNNKGFFIVFTLLAMPPAASIYIHNFPSPKMIKMAKERAKIESEKKEQEAATGGYLYERFQLDGHTYISFYRMGGGTIVHDPDCSCHD